MQSMTEAEFSRLAAAGYNRVPIVLETFADLDTPLSIYLKLANQPYTYLLESVVGGERFGRYSFIGLAATRRLEVRGYDCAEIEGDRVVAMVRPFSISTQSCPRTSSRLAAASPMNE